MSERVHRRRRPENPRKPYHIRIGEPEIVYSKQLGPVIKRWVDNYLAERPSLGRPEFLPDGSAAFAGENNYCGPYEVLSFRTKIGPRRLAAIVSQEIDRVSLSQADAILLAIDEQFRLGNEITVHKNPRWSLDHYFKYMREQGRI